MKLIKPGVLCVMAAICGLAVLAGCGSENQYAFISMTKMSDSTKVIRPGMTEDQIYSQLTEGIFNSGMDRGNSIKLKYEDKTVQNCVAIISYGNGFQTEAGLSFNSKISDVLPLYEKEPGVTVVSNEATKIVLTKQIEGVNYNMTVRAQANGGIKDITIYNADLYTDNDADHE